MSFRRLPTALTGRGLVLLGLIIAGLLTGTPLRADDPPLPIDRYWQQLAETSDRLADIPTTDAARLKSQAQAEAERWAAITSVSLADGSTIPVDHTFLVAQLRADPPDPARLEKLLTTLLETQAALDQVPYGQPELDVLAEILRRPQFIWPAETLSPVQQFWQRLVQNFRAWISRLLFRLGLNNAAGSLTSYLLTTLGVLALLGVLSYVLRSLAASFVTESALDPHAGLEAEILTAASAFNQAQSLSEQGDYRTAVRYLYLASLLLLEERGLLRYDRSLTNREYLRNVAHRPELAAILRDVIDVFDRVWYGYQPLDQTAYDQYATRVGELRRQR